VTPEPVVVASGVSTAQLRPVRSYHQRRGKMTPTQELGLAAGWALFGLELPAGYIDLASVFGSADIVLDIGFGMGESVLTMAAAQPHTGVLGVEVHDRGIGQVLAGISQSGLTNVRVTRGDAAEIVRDHIAPATLSGIRLYFPDPWPKSRHHKRRLVQPGWAALVASRLRPGGTLHCATDWSHYAQHMQAVLDAEPGLVRRDDLVTEFRAARPTTRYEDIGVQRGHTVTDLVYQRPE
jgi:tRNA (guanine-N7-)-methyltransferase